MKSVVGENLSKNTLLMVAAEQNTNQVGLPLSKELKNLQKELKIYLMKIFDVILI